MKLTIQRITALTPQDRLDLAKVWPQIDISQLEAVLSETQRLYAARFNDRLLGGLQLEICGTRGEDFTPHRARSDAPPWSRAIFAGRDYRAESRAGRLVGSR